LLLWRDQLRVATDLRLQMPLRAAAESRLRERLPELELGEKISLARTAPAGLLSFLAGDESHRVVAAVLSNPRLVEAEVAAVVRREKTPAEVLRVIAASERWISRPPIRDAVLSHRRTPVHSALKILAAMQAAEIRRLLGEKPLPPVVRFGAERILSGENTPRPGRAR
jgi:hypothetical protein